MTGAYWKGHERRNSVPLGANLGRRKTDRRPEEASVFGLLDSFIDSAPAAGFVGSENFSAPANDSSPSSDDGGSGSGCNNSDMSGGGGSFDGGGASGDY